MTEGGKEIVDTTWCVCVCVCERVSVCMCGDEGVEGKNNSFPSTRYASIVKGCSICVD